MSKTDDLSAWRVFVTVARSGTLSAAAKALDVEVSSISRAIGGLEKALGCELIRRNMRPMKLTEAGQAALKRMETILRAHDGLMEALVNDNRALTGRVRLSSAPGFATRKLVPFIREFTEAHPGISVDIQTGGTEADVAKGFVDVAVITGEPTLPGLVYVSRGRNLYLPVASPDYISRNGLPVTPEQLRQHRGYIYAGPVRPETKVLCRGAVSAPVEGRALDRRACDPGGGALRHGRCGRHAARADLRGSCRRQARADPSGLEPSARRVLHRDEPRCLAHEARARLLRVVCGRHAQHLCRLRAGRELLRGAPARQSACRENGNPVHGIPQAPCVRIGFAENEEGAAVWGRKPLCSSGLRTCQKLWQMPSMAALTVSVFLEPETSLPFSL